MENQSLFIDDKGNGKLTGNHLKLIAIFAMLIDHIGHTIIWKLYLNACIVDGVVLMGDIVPLEAKRWYIVYIIMRSIGRIVFPIFAFMLVQGFLHTGNIKKYASRILIFAFISEIPYDLALSNSIMDFYSQNVLWTLFIALSMLYGISLVEKHNIKKRIPLILLNIVSATIITFLIKSDGGFGGVLFIAGIYIFRHYPKRQFIAGVFSLIVMAINFMWIQLFGIASFVLLDNYNGTVRKGNKYLFYIFYPLHLMLLWIVSIVIF